MKSFKSYITEVLTPSQYFHTMRTFVNPRRDVSFSDRMFGGKDNHTVVIPFEHQEKPHQDVVEALDKHGYDVHDYKNGLAIGRGEPTINAFGFKTKKRPISIGSILSKPHPDISPSLQQSAIDNFNKRETGQYEMLISRHPVHVAEQSTNKEWRSCLTLGNCGNDRNYESELKQLTGVSPNARDVGMQAPGQNVHRIKDDINAGTHVAYLIRKGDNELRNPLARLSFKPYAHSEGPPLSDIELHNRPKILRAEPNSYVSGSLQHNEEMKNAFEKAAIAHVEKHHNEHQPSGSYQRLRSLGDEGRFNGDYPYSDRANEANLPVQHLNSEDFHSYIDKIDLNTPGGIRKLWNITDPSSNLSAEHISHILNTHAVPGSGSTKLNAVQLGLRAIAHPRASSHDVTRYLSHAIPYMEAVPGVDDYGEATETRRNIVSFIHQDKRIHPELLDNLIEHDYGPYVHAAISNGNLSQKGLHKLVDNVTEYFPPEHRSSTHHEDLTNALLGNKNVNESHLMKLMKRPEVQYKLAVLNHPRVTDRIRELGLNDKNQRVRTKSLRPAIERVGRIRAAK